MGILERIDNITHVPPQYRQAILPPPRSVKIELTGQCNFACAFCARAMRLRAQQEMDQTFFRRLVRDMRAAGVEELGLFYLGESFLVPWLPDAIEYAKGVGFPYVFLTTNGSLAFPDRVEACMKAGLDSLKFSYNYADGAQLREIAKVKEKFFEVIQRNIRDAHTVRETGGYRCGLYASYIEYDGEQGEKMKRAIEEIRPYVDEVYALPLYNQATLVEEEEKKKGWRISAGNMGRLNAKVPPIPCWAVLTEGHITWDGKLSACCFDHNDRFTMADLTRVAFMAGWNSPRFQALRQAHLRRELAGTPCERCVGWQ